MTTLSLVAAFMLFTAAPAFALHCINANKAPGAGAVTEDDIKMAGQSGNWVAPGAFVSGEELGPGVPDVFIRGPEERDFDEAELGIDIQGFGSLPEGPHVNGGSNGVVTLPPPPSG